jgi:hypothetical protein
MKRISLIFTFCFYLSNSFSQQEHIGHANFLVDVDNGYFEILVNDTMLVKNFKVTLPVGKHVAKVWSPGYITREVDFEVYKDSTTQNYVKMAISNERKQFESDYKDYRMKFHKSLTVPGTLTLGLALTSSALMIRGYDLRKQILNDIELYHASGSYNDAVYFRNEVETNDKKYDRTRIMFYSFLGLSAASLGTTIYTYTKFKRNNTEPTFNPESPFKEKYSLQVTPFGCRLVIPIG